MGLCEITEIGTRTCSRYGGEERCIEGFSEKNLREGDPAIDGRIILKWIFESLDERHTMDQFGLE